MVTCRIWLLCAFFVGISAKDSALTNDASTARIDVLLFETAVNAEYTTKTYHLTGNFSPAGAKIGAEGEVLQTAARPQRGLVDRRNPFELYDDTAFCLINMLEGDEEEGKSPLHVILQFHPRGLCNDYDDDETEFGTVAVVSLESSYIDPHPCLSVYDKAKRAIHRGATAVIFVVSDNPSAISQLEAEKSSPLDRPIVLLTGQDAHKLMEIVNQVEEAWARIQPPPQLTPDPSSNEFFDMGIFVAFFILISIICLLLVLKLRWRQKRKQSSQARQALNALSKMEVRKYCRNNEQRYSQKILPDDRWATTLSIASDGTICAICLEEFREGEELRIVPCAHEFHKHCVDPWLLSNRTCPLCMFNILDCGLDGKSSEASPSGHVSPVDQQLRVSLPNSPTRDASWEGVYAAPPNHHHHRTSSSHHHHHHHHKHSRSRCPQSTSKRENRSAVVSGSNVQEGVPRLPSTSQSQLERWFGRGPLTWQSNCEYVCSHCHRHINCNGQYNSRCVTPRQLGLASFESHYVVNSSYVPWSGGGGGGGGGVSCSRGASGRRGVSQGARHYRDQCHVPVQVHLEAVTSTACQKGATNHQLRGSESGSSLSLSAFNADFECSDSTSSPENFDSTQSVYGSSTTCHSEVTGCDPCVYSRPSVVQQYWNIGPPAQLTPSCLHKTKIQNSNGKQNITSDSDDPKRSGSDANASASSGSNFSTRVNTSRKDGIQPYKPQSSVSTVTTPDSVSSQVRTNHVCSPSSKSPTSPESKTDTPNTITPQTHYPQPLPKSSDSSRQQTPCACCGDNEVWDQRSPASPEDRTSSGDKPERGSGVKSQRRSSRGTPTRKPRGHLTLPVQSVATLKNTQGTVITMPVQGIVSTAANTSRKVMEEIV